MVGYKKPENMLDTNTYYCRFCRKIYDPAAFGRCPHCGHVKAVVPGTDIAHLATIEAVRYNLRSKGYH